MDDSTVKDGGPGSSELTDSLADQDPRLTALAAKDPELVKLYMDLYTSIAVNQGCGGCHIAQVKKAIRSPHSFNGDSAWEFLKSWALRKDTVQAEATRVAGFSEAEVEAMRTRGFPPRVNFFAGQQDRNLAWFRMRLTVHGEQYDAEEEATFERWVKTLDLKVPDGMEAEVVAELAEQMRINAGKTP
jgi:hypothetical protein